MAEARPPCATCRWWLRNPHTVLVGECRRMPPQPADNAADPRWWPTTRRNDWCGEHQEAEPHG